ncbi:hypothetical protein CesoFtcFv8_018401 [Champsocephalus esox]|uniref:Uncharacterized protein n=1 Tax=Champsocephalus esox TaxID=159716 RepID=A0AAN8BGX7_9TELE|nr:hypothetical protein CesoFtcFv8_018401 [Champsocephalus esox]
MPECERVKGRKDQTPMGGTSNPVALPEREQEESTLASSSQSTPPLHPSTFSLLASSFFFCLSGDDGRLSVTRGLTQIHWVRRRTVSRVMRKSQPFTHGPHPPQSYALVSQAVFSVKGAKPRAPYSQIL